MTAEADRAVVWQVDAQSGMHKTYATGLRNPTALAIHPDDGGLWAVVNERDEIGPDLVPDYLTSVQRSEEHTSELQSRENLVCRLLLEKKKQPDLPNKSC